MLEKKLKGWFQVNKRELPWREEPTPYRVWVSEVMLQQTQVAVVIPYFLHWMERFPTVESLANASLDEVIKEWEGLGYYSRARNLHQGAKDVLAHYGGVIPDTPEELRKIKGIGDYTSGAILSFAFNKKAPAIDGNVMRVAARLFGIRGDVGKRAAQLEVRQAVEALLPDEEPWVVAEALIELGATVCMKKPSCQQCPLKSDCRAFLEGAVHEIPNKPRKGQVKKLFRSVAVITAEEKLLLRRGTSGALMHDLHEFPYFETSSEGLNPHLFSKMIEKELGLPVRYHQVLPKEKHSFTSFSAELFPVQFHAESCSHIVGYQWFPISSLPNLAFSSGHRRILASALLEHI